MNDKNWGTFENERQNLKINFNKKNVENEDFYDNNNSDFSYDENYNDNNNNENDILKKEIVRSKSHLNFNTKQN